MGLFSSLLGNAGTVEPQKLEQEYSNLLIENEAVNIYDVQKVLAKHVL